MEWTHWIALLVVALSTIWLAIYKYLTRKYGYWEAQGVKTVKPRLIYGSMYAYFQKKPFFEVDDDRYKEYGKLFGTYEFFFNRTLNIGDPELIKLVLVKDFHVFTNRRYLKSGNTTLDFGLQSVRDEQWKRIRAIVSPTFTSGKMRKMNPLFLECTKSLVQNFMEAEKTGKAFDVKRYFSSFTMDVIGATAFGLQLDSLKNPDHPFAVNARKLFERDNSLRGIIYLILGKVIKPIRDEIWRSLGFEYFIEVSKEIIQKRKNQGQNKGPKDFVQLLLDAREGKLEKDDQEKEEHPNHYFQSDTDGKTQNIWNVKKTLSDEEIYAQCVVFLLAGHETSATTLAFLGYELALNPDVQDKLYKEVHEAYEKNGEFNYDVVSKMSYLDAVISESLRLHTVAFRLEREASEDYVLGSTGITVPKGGLIGIMAHCIHHDPEFFPEPEKFNPDRFLPENRSSIQPYTYLPFGDGPRNCVAMRFAILELKICLCEVMHRISFVATDETRAPIDFFLGQTLLIPKQVPLRVERRPDG